MKEFEHFTVCFFCTTLIDPEKDGIGRSRSFSFVVPRAGERADICRVCLGEIINTMTSHDVSESVGQRIQWEERGREEEEYERAAKAEEQEEEARQLQEEADDRGIYAL